MYVDWCGCMWIDVDVCGVSSAVNYHSHSFATLIRCFAGPYRRRECPGLFYGRVRPWSIERSYLGGTPPINNKGLLY